MYDENSHITSILEVEEFAKYLYEVKGINFHPDDDFADYAIGESNQPFFNVSEVAIFNRLVDECFCVCRQYGADIYDVMGKFHPLMQD